MLHKIAEQNEDASLVRGLDNIMDAADVFLVNVSREARTNQGRVSVGPSETPLAGRFLRAVEVYLEKQSPLFSSDNLMRLRSRQGRARLFGRFSREDGLLLDSTGHANFSSEGLEAFARSYDYDYLVRIYLSELQRIRSSQARQKAMQSRPDQRGHAQRPVKPDRETPARSYPAPSSPGIRGQYSSLAPSDPRLHQHPERWTPPAKVPKSDFDGN